MEEILMQIEPEDSPNRVFNYAGKGKRFTNFIIDNIVSYILLILFWIVLGLFTKMLATIYIFIEDSLNSIENKLIIFILVNLAYYTSFEYWFKGKTPGKLFTKTRAVTEQCTRMDFETTLIRSLCRLIPFDPLSFYLWDHKSGWHDKYSKTIVIDEEEINTKATHKVTKSLYFW